LFAFEIFAAPVHYRADTLFAMDMIASPLGWFEASGLPQEYVTEIAPLVAEWKRERKRFQTGNIIPVGEAPDGVAWTGFVSLSTHEPGGYVLLFRELNESSTFTLDARRLLPGDLACHILGGRGSAALQQGVLKVSIPAPLDFLWIRLDARPHRL
jgi:alpha-galactosidase